MEKKQLKANQKTSLLALHKETLRQLKKSELQQVAGGTRIRIPIGFGADTTPIYGDAEEP